MSVLAGSIKLQSTISETLADDTTRTEAITVNLNPSKTTTYQDGATAGKVQRAYYREFSLASTTLVINLSTIVCNDGNTGMAYVREILVFNEDTVDGHTLIYGGGTTPFNPDAGGTTPTTTIQAGVAKRIVSKPLGATGHAVSTNVNVKLDSGANTVAGKILILGHN